MIAPATPPLPAELRPHSDARRNGRDVESLDELPLGPRSVLRRGDWFSVSKGPRWHGRPAGKRGVYVFQRAWKRGRRVFVDAIHAAAGGLYTLYVAGPSYSDPTIPGLKMHPHKLHPRRAAKGGGS